MNIEHILEKVERACIKSDRKSSEITIVGITKNKDYTSIIDSYNSGIVNIGESYVQEALTKITECKNHMSGESFKSIIWHFVGRLQSNKIKYLNNKFSYIHSVDSLKQIDEINKRIEHDINIFFELHTGSEKTKGGLKLDNIKLLIEAVMNINSGSSEKRIIPSGLMTLPPYSEDTAKSASFFSECRESMVKLNACFGLSMSCLSMGMSDDFEYAIMEGATHIRLGTILYGERSY